MEVQIKERTPDGHPQLWALYSPEPYEPFSDEDISIHLWFRRVNIFTSRIEAIVALDNLIGKQIKWKLYNEAFPELWIGMNGHSRWLMEAIPLNPPGADIK